MLILVKNNFIKIELVKFMAIIRLSAIREIKKDKDVFILNVKNADWKMRLIMNLLIGQ